MLLKKGHSCTRNDMLNGVVIRHIALSLSYVSVRTALQRSAVSGDKSSATREREYHAFVWDIVAS
jgi:hypothetical protein